MYCIEVQHNKTLKTKWLVGYDFEDAMRRAGLNKAEWTPVFYDYID